MQRYFMKLLFTFFSTVALVCASNTYAAEDYTSFLKAARAEALRKGISQEILDKVLPSTLTLDEKVLSKLVKQPESTFTFKNYHDRLVSKIRIKNGRSKIANHKSDINSASEKYNIPTGVIAALWGIETAYGKSTGNYSIVGSLATLAYDSHRKEFFRKEMFHALDILQQGHISPDDMTGSWAGAMGQCQFMPSSFMTFATDGDGDGRKDIWQTEADVFASTANYLKRSGWDSGAKWGERIILSKILPKMKLSGRGLSDPKPVLHWKKLGVKAAYGGFNGINNSAKARLFMPDGPSGKSYIVYNNFDVILKWNRSSYFAFSVLDLADKLSNS